MALHLRAWMRQQLEVCLAPFGEGADCFRRSLRMAADILGQVLGEVRDDPSLSPLFEQSRDLRPLLADLGRRQRLNLPISRLPSIPPRARA
jgi:hypothetical protein